ncbi:MAG: N-6 DNA methylase [Xenococcaceae cyanobacterium MO_234.B1]|nr:N-6 DNA methylase [Xenococcaceae cyanobacterium MO_234.B1]
MLLIGEDEQKARIYTEYYSIERLRALAERPMYGKEGFQDKWQGLLMTFRLFDENWRGELLGLSPLNGDLFGSSVLETLEQCSIDNYDLLRGIKNLSLYTNKGQLRRVNYAALDVEELGSIYESLLDFAPKFEKQQGDYQFKLVTGSDRKTTGSYYTPPELVAQLIKTALEPVIEERLKEVQSLAEQEAALLSLTVCDPACGSGHFLLAAARRIGKELAKVRTEEAQPGVEPIRTAIRDVIQHCIYGVDLNPLAVDLCKVALWIEGFNRGKPLSFLDHRIKCGNSLVGVLDLDCLNDGIPDNAYKAVTGDDKKLATQIKKENKQQCKNKDQLVIPLENLEKQRSYYGEVQSAVAQLPEDKTGDIKQKQQQYRDTRKETPDNPWWRHTSACNLWTAAFFTPLTEQKLQLLPTSSALFQLLQGNTTTQKIVDAANKLAKEKRFFHWALEFPEVFENGGFCCVLGNPPWERIKVQEKEFFSSRNINIASSDKAKRADLIKQLEVEDPKLLSEFNEAKYDAEAQSKFIKHSGRYCLTAVGNFNTYAIFTENSWLSVNKKGKLGYIIPPGIATDDPTKLFIQNVIKSYSLESFYDFTNRGYIFPSVESTFSFSLLTLSKNKVKTLSLAAQLWKIQDLAKKERIYKLEVKDIYTLNPNTLNLPIIKTSIDLELIKKIYYSSSVLVNEEKKQNSWDISLSLMFGMSVDSKKCC